MDGQRPQPGKLGMRALYVEEGGQQGELEAANKQPETLKLTKLLLIPIYLAYSFFHAGNGGGCM
jgi:hypothetical protein